MVLLSAPPTPLPLFLFEKLVSCRLWSCLELYAAKPAFGSEINKRFKKKKSLHVLESLLVLVRHFSAELIRDFSAELNECLLKNNL